MADNPPDFSSMSQSERAIVPPWIESSQDKPSRDNTFRSLIFGIVLTSFFFLFLIGLEDVAKLSIPMTRKFIGNGWTPYAAVFLTMWSLSILVDKMIAVRRQKAAFDVEYLPRDVDLNDSRNAEAILGHINAATRTVKDNILGPRIHLAIEHFFSSGSRREAADLFRDENEADLGDLENSYTLVRAFLWAIPILGFVGTVLGVSAAVGGFSSFLQQVQTIDQIKDQLGEVTTGLSTAFDTTFVALSLSLLVMLVMSTVEKVEVGQLRRVDEFCQNKILRRLPSDRKGSGSDHDLLAGSLQHLVQKLSHGDIAGDDLKDRADLISDLMRHQDKIVHDYMEHLGNSRRELEELVEARQNLEKEILNGPATASLSDLLEKLHTMLQQLEPALRKFTEKPIEVDVQLVAGQVSPVIRRPEA